MRTVEDYGSGSQTDAIAELSRSRTRVDDTRYRIERDAVFSAAPQYRVPGGCVLQCGRHREIRSRERVKVGPVDFRRSRLSDEIVNVQAFSQTRGRTNASRTAKMGARGSVFRQTQKHQTNSRSEGKPLHRR